MGHSIGPRRNNTNETPGCSLVTRQREDERNIRVFVGHGDASNTNETCKRSLLTAAYRDAATRDVAA